METLIHPVVDVRVLELILLFILFLWLRSQLHRVHGIALLFLLQLDRPVVEPTSLAVGWSIHLSRVRLSISVGCGIGRIPHPSLCIILLILLQGDEQTHARGIRSVLQVGHDGAMFGP